nr:trypsin-like peptidase domain-containing protein [Rickettsiaceae bacterium]
MLKRALIFLLFVFSCTTVLATTPVPAGFADVVQPLLPAVVNVYTSKHTKKSKVFSGKKIPRGMPPGIEEFFERFEYPFGFEEMYETPKSTSLGSGFIIESSGYIVTNHHVIESADEIYIKLGTNEELPAKLIGSDARTDLALLKVETKSPLPFVRFGDSAKSRVGDWVIAIGNPFGLGGTVTTGIISSKGRDITDGFVDDFIQT